MIVREQFRRGEAIGRRSTTLPASIYNRMRLLLRRCERGCVFVPIRSMQYQAVVDEEEVIFVDGLGPRIVEIAWQHFRPQDRSALDEPVPYQIVVYHEKAQDTLRRLQAEFGAALLQLERRLEIGRGSTREAQVIGFDTD